MTATERAAGGAGSQILITLLFSIQRINDAEVAGVRKIRNSEVCSDSSATTLNTTLGIVGHQPDARHH
jgi:hypothetical protein